MENFTGEIIKDIDDFNIEKELFEYYRPKDFYINTRGYIETFNFGTNTLSTFGEKYGEIYKVVNNLLFIARQNKFLISDGKKIYL